MVAWDVLVLGSLEAESGWQLGLVGAIVSRLLECAQDRVTGFLS